MHIFASGRLLLLSTFMGLISFPVGTIGQVDPGPKASTNSVDKAECEAQLLRIHAAIQQYYARYDRLPDWLSDLNREHLIRESVLTCPYVAKTYTLVEWHREIRGDCFLDRKTSYSYEFNAAPLALFGGESTTWREYKERAMKQMGSNVVPIVRCFAHRPVLNLTYAGTIYESGTYWEDNLTNHFEHAELTADALFSDRIVLPKFAPGDFPSRLSSLDSRHLDLTRFYNARLTDTWLHAPSFTENLAEFPAGVFHLPEVSFDARGLIQLKGKSVAVPYPLAVEKIPVGRCCRALHFLHAANAHAPANTPVGQYVLHYADNSVHEIALLYDRDLSEWWTPLEEGPVSPMQVAWRGSKSDSFRNGRKLQVFRSRYENPKPDAMVQSLDFVSANSSAAPFLIAVTLEP